jgi:hypothetical protein
MDEIQIPSYMDGGEFILGKRRKGRNGKME